MPGESIGICLLHPLKEQLTGKTDRPLKLLDYSDKSPELIVVGTDNKMTLHFVITTLMF
jgi:hypothetical protein